MGEGFAAASRPGPGQWAAVVRALELWGTQPSACPRAPPPSSPSGSETGGSGGPRGEGQSPPRRTFCHKEHHSRAPRESQTSSRPERSRSHALRSRVLRVSR